jgi:hypothetical protein
MAIAQSRLRCMDVVREWADMPSPGIRQSWSTQIPGRPAPQGSDVGFVFSLPAG